MFFFKTRLLEFPKINKKIYAISYLIIKMFQQKINLSCIIAAVI